MYNMLGPYYFKRAYRMSYKSFNKLVETISPLFGIAHSEVHNSVWNFVDAVTSCSLFDIEYPSDISNQKEIAAAFAVLSGAGFECCAGASDGILIWTHKPSERCCEESSCRPQKFYCGRKHKYGLNCQAVSDARGRFLDFSIVYPGSTSDCFAFEGMDLYTRREEGLLHRDLCLFGDNAYLNSIYMATPYESATGVKDSYNFFHSQLRIRVECAFGMFTQRWGILRQIIPKNISLRRTIAMVICLAKLHNFCIDERDNNVESLLAIDELSIERRGAFRLQQYNQSTIEGIHTTNSLPLQLIGAGNHF